MTQKAYVAGVPSLTLHIRRAMGALAGGCAPM